MHDGMSFTAETDMYQLPLSVKANNLILVQFNLKEEDFEHLYNVSLQKSDGELELNVFDVQKKERIIKCEGTVEKGIKNCEKYFV